MVDTLLSQDQPSPTPSHAPARSQGATEAQPSAKSAHYKRVTAKQLALRQRILDIARLRLGVGTEGGVPMTFQAIADHLHLHIRTVFDLFARLKDLGEGDRAKLLLDEVVVPRAIEKAAGHVEAADKEMIIEVLKGRGVFKQHQAVKTEGGAPQTAILIQWEGAPKGAAPVLEGHVFGQPQESGDASPVRSDQG